MPRNTRGLTRLSVALALLGAILYIAVSTAPLWARGGGGEGFSGGGGHSSGGGFSGGGGGFSGGRGFDRDFGFPSGSRSISSSQKTPAEVAVVFIFVFVIIAISVLIAHATEEERRSQVIRDGRRATERNARGKALQQLLEEDPDFNEQLFLDRVGLAFEKVQACWTAQQLKPLRPFVSDGVYERFTLQILEQKDLGYRNVMENVVVQHVELAAANVEPEFVAVSVRIQAMAKDYKIELRSGRVIQGSEAPPNFVEYLTFVRRRGLPQVKRGLIEGACPNCGNVLKLNQADVCESCGGKVLGGTHDDVLTEITQEFEWRGAKPESCPAAAKYRNQHDPAFNERQLEDRASVIFWRKAMADRLGDVKPLLKMALPSFTTSYADKLHMQGGLRRFRGGCAVGSVNVVDVKSGPEFDSAHVQIAWAGSSMEVNAAGEQKKTSENAIFRHEYVLVRKAGVQTRLERSFISCHCPSCGAPEGDSISSTCEYCGAVRNDGSSDWVLSEILTAPLVRESYALASNHKQNGNAVVLGQPMEHGVLTPPAATSDLKGKMLLAWMLAMARSDGNVAERERALLLSVAKRRGLSREEVLEIRDGVNGNGHWEIEPPEREAALELLEAMAEIGLADGRIHPSERELLLMVGKSWNLQAYDVERILRRKSSQLYSQARLAQLDPGPGYHR